MEIVRYVVAGLAALAWGATTVANAQLAWHKLTREEETGSFVPFGALFFGAVAILSFPRGETTARAVYLWIPVALDVGVWLYGYALVWILISKLRGRDPWEE